MIKGKSTAEMRRILNLKNDFTAEEEVRQLREFLVKKQFHSEQEQLLQEEKGCEQEWASP